jgi:hypothetical protein
MHIFPMFDGHSPVFTLCDELMDQLVGRVDPLVSEYRPIARVKASEGAEVAKDPEEGKDWFCGIHGRGTQRKPI